MYPIDVFQTFRFQIYMQVLNDETIDQQKQFIQWATRLPEQIKMQYAAHCKMKRAKLTPKAKSAPICGGPIWNMLGRFGQKESKQF